MNRINCKQMDALVERAWSMLDAQIEEIKNLYDEMHAIPDQDPRKENAMHEYFHKLHQIKNYEKIKECTDTPQPYVAHYYIIFIEGFAFLRGTGDWLAVDEMIIKRTKGKFSEVYQPDADYDKYAFDSDHQFFKSEKFLYKRLAWGERCDKIFTPDFLVVRK